MLCAMEFGSDLQTPSMASQTHSSPQRDRSNSPPRRRMQRSASQCGVKDGRSVEDMLKRNRSDSSHSFEGFTDKEIAKMRQAYMLFRPKDSPEINREDMADILIHLGYLGASNEKVEQIVSEVSRYAALDFQEIVDVAEKYAKHEREELQAAFNSRCRPDGLLVCEDLIEALRTLGIIALRRTVVEVLDSIDLKPPDKLNFTEFLDFMAVYRVSEGFRKDEVSTAQKVFRSFPSFRTSHLQEALLELYGPYSHGHIKKLISKLSLPATQLINSLIYHKFCAPP